MRKEGAFMKNTEYEALKDAIKVLFELLTYEEQEQIIELIKASRQSEDRK